MGERLHISESYQDQDGNGFGAALCAIKPQKLAHFNPVARLFCAC